MVGDPRRENDPGATGLSKNNTATDAAIYVLSPQNAGDFGLRREGSRS